MRSKADASPEKKYPIFVTDHKYRVFSLWGSCLLTGTDLEIYVGDFWDFSEELRNVCSATMEIKPGIWYNLNIRLKFGKEERMKKRILNKELAEVVAQIRHGEMLFIADAGSGTSSKALIHWILPFSILTLKQ